MSSKKRKVCTNLPDPLELMSKTKATRKNIKTTFIALSSLDLLQCEMRKQVMRELSENEKFKWLIANFSWDAVSSVSDYFRSFPRQRSFFVYKVLFRYICVVTPSFLVDQCSTIRTSTPTISCTLLWMWIVTSVLPRVKFKLFTTVGVKSASKVTLRCQPCKLFYTI